MADGLQILWPAEEDPDTGDWVPKALAATNEVKRLLISGQPTSGDFSLKFGGTYSWSFPTQPTAAQVQNILENMNTIGVGNVVVTASGPWDFDIEFVGTFAGKDVGLLEVATDNLAPPNSTGVTITTPVEGGVEEEIPPPDIDQPDLLWNGAPIGTAANGDNSVVLAAFSVQELTGAEAVEVSGFDQIVVTVAGRRYHVLLGIVKGTENVVLLGVHTGETV